MNGTNTPLTEPVENVSEAFGSLHYALSHPEKAVHEVVCQRFWAKEYSFCYLEKKKLINKVSLFCLTTYVKEETEGSIQNAPYNTHLVL